MYLAYVMLLGVVFNVFRVFRGYECFPMVITGFQWLSQVSNGYWGFSMIIGGFQWLSQVLSGVFNGYRRFPMVIGGFQWLSGVSNGYHRFSMVIGGFQWLSGVKFPMVIRAFQIGNLMHAWFPVLNKSNYGWYQLTWLSCMVLGFH